MLDRILCRLGFHKWSLPFINGVFLSPTLEIKAGLEEQDITAQSVKDLVVSGSVVGILVIFPKPRNVPVVPTQNHRLPLIKRESQPVTLKSVMSTLPSWGKLDHADRSQSPKRSLNPSPLSGPVRTLPT